MKTTEEKSKNHTKHQMASYLFQMIAGDKTLTRRQKDQRILNLLEASSDEISKLEAENDELRALMKKMIAVSDKEQLNNCKTFKQQLRLLDKLLDSSILYKETEAEKVKAQDQADLNRAGFILAELTGTKHSSQPFSISEVADLSSKMVKCDQVRETEYLDAVNNANRYVGYLTIISELVGFKPEECNGRPAGNSLVKHVRKLMEESAVNDSGKAAKKNPVLKVNELKPFIHGLANALGVVILSERPDEGDFEEDFKELLKIACNQIGNYKSVLSKQSDAIKTIYVRTSEILEEPIGAGFDTFGAINKNLLNIEVEFKKTQHFKGALALFMK